MENLPKNSEKLNEIAENNILPDENSAPPKLEKPIKAETEEFKEAEISRLRLWARSFFGKSEKQKEVTPQPTQQETEMDAKETEIRVGNEIRKPLPNILRDIKGECLSYIKNPVSRQGVDFVKYIDQFCRIEINLKRYEGKRSKHVFGKDVLVFMQNLIEEIKEDINNLDEKTPEEIVSAYRKLRSTMEKWEDERGIVCIGREITDEEAKSGDDLLDRMPEEKLEGRDGKWHSAEGVDVTKGGARIPYDRMQHELFEAVVVSREQWQELEKQMKEQGRDFCLTEKRNNDGSVEMAPERAIVFAIVEPGYFVPMQEYSDNLETGKTHDYGKNFITRARVYTFVPPLSE